ncbi:hypothetical protein [Thioclava pacifica]|uniref:Gamma-glutamyl kinase n=1 Tax=Thioclava pacifica DSM 10166 TaxID=1353537 RepID=A0A074JQV1_9RHOB|nr:hypothetical protein [Thioclava pacifica]KEO51742.1 hypothetical protein TP2_09695 [Thioclava pacifica DSM 10166]
MLIFWKQRLAFLATPKAGSSAVEAALEPLAELAVTRPPELKHVSGLDFRTHFAPFLSAQAGAPFTTIALMREPIDWLRSWYRFRLFDVGANGPEVSPSCSFEQFARDFISYPRPEIADFPTQSEFLCDGSGTPLVDRIFPYERIGDFVHYLEDQLDFAITLPRVNVPPAADVGLSAATEEALRDTMAPDIALYAQICS